ncbi:hypothetical protein BDV93DRAFT_505458 [Ceratobasidium sp. AG-I]|nr:hypothetical protein BDV93DRAFT_505458 [Ceratobasidium sp. AG-I]
MIEADASTKTWNEKHSQTYRELNTTQACRLSQGDRISRTSWRRLRGSDTGSYWILSSHQQDSYQPQVQQTPCPDEQHAATSSKPRKPQDPSTSPKPRLQTLCVESNNGTHRHLRYATTLALLSQGHRKRSREAYLRVMHIKVSGALPTNTRRIIATAHFGWAKPEPPIIPPLSSSQRNETGDDRIRFNREGACDFSEKDPERWLTCVTYVHKKEMTETPYPPPLVQHSLNQRAG